MSNNPFTRSRQRGVRLAAVVQAAYAFQKADQVVDEAIVSDDATYEQQEAAMEERARCIRVLFDALDSYAPYHDTKEQAHA